MQLQQNLARRGAQIFQRRKFVFGTNALVMTLALIGILVLINVLATRYHKRLDLTENHGFSLSQQSIQILQGLKNPVQIIGFFTSKDATSRDQVDNLLKEYASHSGKVVYRFVDPDADPVTARNYNITTDGTVVVESGQRRQQATGTDEQAITGAILKVIQDRPTSVYFLTGHRERSIDNTDRDGYSSAKSLLEQDNFKVAALNLTITSTIPLSNTVLVVADPQTPLAPKEEQAIATYVSSGGRLLVLGNPVDPAPLTSLSARAGLVWNNDFLLDQQYPSGGNPTTPAVLQYPSSPITKDLNGQATLFPTVRTLTQSDKAPDDLTITPVLQSSANSRAATDISNGQIKLGPNDKPGPLTFGYSVEGPINTGATSRTTSTRLVAIGDADFASNAVIDVASANGTLFRNAVAWLAAQDQLIAIPSKDPTDHSVVLTAGQSGTIFYGTSIGMPLLVLVAGVVVWWRRR
jgi:ABC-type uncharacterized transport system involved in gliding motility auxiliary subunit